MQIPSQPIDVSFRDNDYATSEDTNNQLPSGRTFDSFTEVVEESELESDGVSAVASPKELDDVNREVILSNPLSVQATGFESELNIPNIVGVSLERASFVELAAHAAPSTLTKSLDASLPSPLQTGAGSRSLNPTAENLPFQSVMIHTAVEDAVALQVTESEMLDSELLGGLKAIAGAGESGFEFSQGNENDSGSSEPNLRAAIPGFIQDSAAPLRHLPGTLAVTAEQMSTVTETVTDNLVQQIRLTERGEQKQMTMQLHPSELGQLTLQLDWEKDVLQVKILASEMIAADLLKQNKSQLVQALAENGIDFDSLDISYQSEQSNQQSDEETAANYLSADVFNEAEESNSIEKTVTRVSSSLIDIRV